MICARRIAPCSDARSIESNAFAGFEDRYASVGCSWRALAADPESHPDIAWDVVARLEVPFTGTQSSRSRRAPRAHG